MMVGFSVNTNALGLLALQPGKWRFRQMLTSAEGHD